MVNGYLFEGWPVGLLGGVGPLLSSPSSSSSRSLPRSSRSLALTENAVIVFTFARIFSACVFFAGGFFLQFLEGAVSGVAGAF